MLIFTEDLKLIRDLSSLLADDALELIGAEPNQTEVALKEHMPMSAVIVDGCLDEAFRQVRAVRVMTPDLPVILVATTYAEKEEIEARQEGAFYCMIGEGEYNELYRFMMRASELAN